MPASSAPLLQFPGTPCKSRGESPAVRQPGTSEIDSLPGKRLACRGFSPPSSKDIPGATTCHWPDTPPCSRSSAHVYLRASRAGAPRTALHKCLLHSPDPSSPTSKVQYGREVRVIAHSTKQDGGGGWGLVGAPAPHGRMTALLAPPPPSPPPRNHQTGTSRSRQPPRRPPDLLLGLAQRRRSPAADRSSALWVPRP